MLNVPVRVIFHVGTVTSHLHTVCSCASLTKQLSRTSCTYFRVYGFVAVGLLPCLLLLPLFVGICVWSMFSNVLFSVLSSLIDILLTIKKERAGVSC